VTNPLSQPTAHAISTRLRNLRTKLFVGAFSLSAIAVLAAACSSNTPADDGKITCGPAKLAVGKSQFCRCPEFEFSGEQECLPDGTFGACGPCESTPTCKSAEGKTVKRGDRTPCTCAGSTTKGEKTCIKQDTFGSCGPCPSAPKPDAGRDSGPSNDGGPMPSGDCGNGTVDEGEICDAKDSRFCRADCTPIPNPAGAVNCGSPQVLHIWPDAKFMIPRVSTRSYDREHSTELTCNPEDIGGASSKDRVYELRLHGKGDLFIGTTKADFDHQLFMQTACNDSSTQLSGGDGCSDRSRAPDANNGPEALLPTVEEKTYFLWLDGKLNTEGTADLEFEFFPQ
jgi:hypothetical protein